MITKPDLTQALVKEYDKLINIYSQHLSKDDYDEEEDIVRIVLWFPTPIREHLSGRHVDFYLEKEEIEDFHFFMKGVYDETR